MTLVRRRGPRRSVVKPRRSLNSTVPSRSHAAEAQRVARRARAPRRRRSRARSARTCRARAGAPGRSNSVVQRRATPTQLSAERAERVRRPGTTTPALNASWAPTRTASAAATASASAAQRPPRHRRRRHQQPEQHDQQRGRRRSLDERSGDAVERRHDRVGLDLGARHLLVAETRSGGRPGASAPTRRRPRSCRAARRPAPGRASTSRERVRCGSCRAGRGSRSSPVAVERLARDGRAARQLGSWRWPSSAGRQSRRAAAAARRRRRREAAGSRPAPRSPAAWRHRRECPVSPRSLVSEVPSTTAVAPVDRVDQRLVLRGLGRLRELDVVGDDAGTGLAQAVDQLRMHGARERPLQVELVERLGVDRDDGHLISGVSRLPRTSNRASTLLSSSARPRCVACAASPSVAASSPAPGVRQQAPPLLRWAARADHPRLRAAARGDVALALVHDHGALADQVADGHRSCRDAHERRGARVLGQPARPAHARGRVLAARTKSALAVAPQPSLLLAFLPALERAPAAQSSGSLKVSSVIRRPFSRTCR